MAGLTLTEIATELEMKKNESGYASKIYKNESNIIKGESLSTEIKNKRELLKYTNKNTPVNWDDIEDVKNRADLYLQACEIAKVFPTVSGLAAYGFGVSARAVNYYLQRHNNDVTEFIYMVKDIIADILVNQAEYSNANPVMSIFVLKNSHGWKDSIELSNPNYEPPNERQVEDIMRRYLETQDDDLEDV